MHYDLLDKEEYYLLTPVWVLIVVDEVGLLQSVLYFNK